MASGKIEKKRTVSAMKDRADPKIPASKTVILISSSEEEVSDAQTKEGSNTLQKGPSIHGTTTTSMQRTKGGRASRKQRKSTGPRAWHPSLSPTAATNDDEEIVFSEEDNNNVKTKSRSNRSEKSNKGLLGWAPWARELRAAQGGENGGGDKEPIDKDRQTLDLEIPVAKKGIGSSKKTPLFIKREKTTTDERKIARPVHKGSEIQNALTDNGASPVPRTGLPAAPTDEPVSSVSTGPPDGWTPEEWMDRRTFMRRLRRADRGTNRPLVSLTNDIDHETPPLTFVFIDENVIGEGVNKVDDAAMSGCSCRPENGRHVGCEYTSCECLEQAARQLDGRRRFPYYCTGARAGCLQEFYLNSRNHIFECNHLCNCPDHCKNKVVQKGRTIRVEIFKTPDRGWGLRTLEHLRKGQFIDTYKGEIITPEEADRRENGRQAKESYFYMLDKFAAEIGITNEECYVIDGEFMGGICRFMNHSCAPNCRQFTVSYNHSDAYVYEIALFAIDDIEAGTELTFNYTDNEDVARPDGGDGVDPEERKENDQEPVKCLCGAANCKKYLWM